VSLTRSARLASCAPRRLRACLVRSQVRSFVRDFLATEEGVALEEDKLLTYLHGSLCLCSQSGGWGGGDGKTRRETRQLGVYTSCARG
jgi:hypothetical protein